ncbi:MAG: DUF732 domain-containing protein [Microcoleaceae cyanobacterium]
MKHKKLTVAVLISALSAMLHQSVVAQSLSNSSGCYWTNSSGEVMGISSRLCGRQPTITTSPKPQTTADKFIQAYKDAAEEFSQDPLTKNLVLRTIEMSPEAEIIKAKAVCKDLSSGLSLEQILEQPAAELNEEENGATYRANFQLVILRHSLAMEYYCPQFQS